MISVDLLLIIFLQNQGNKSRVEQLIKKSLVMEVKRTIISRVWGVLPLVLMFLCLGLFGTMSGNMLNIVFSEQRGEQ